MPLAKSVSVGQVGRKLQFNSVAELAAYQEQLRSIRQKYGDSRKATQLIRLLETKTRSRQKNRPEFIASVIRKGGIDASQSSSGIVVTFEQAQPKVVVGAPRETRTRLKPRKRRPVQEMARITQEKIRCRRLLEDVVDHAEATRWMSAPNAVLDNTSPLEAIEMGHGERVAELILRVAEGIYV